MCKYIWRLTNSAWIINNVNIIEIIKLELKYNIINKIKIIIYLSIEIFKKSLITFSI